MAFDRITRFAALFVRFLKFSICVTSFLILFIKSSYAQISENLSYNLYLKSHTFFDNGSHKLSDKNDAWSRGAGLNVFWQAKPKVSLSMGYGLGFIDSLKYSTDFTQVAAFHQVDVNAIYTPFNKRRIQPAVFFGYAFNYIPQLKEFDTRNFGTNVNLGYAVELRIKSFVNLRYASTYAISLSEQIRYNFKNELGLVYNLNNFKSNSTKKEILEYQARIENDLVMFDKYEVEIDSLARISEKVAAKTIENYKLKETISLIVEQKNTLSQENALLERSNSEFKDSIAKLLFFSDSIVTVRKNDFYIIDSFGDVQSPLSYNFSDGYYVAVPNFLTFDDAIMGQQNSLVLSLGTSFILYHNGLYTILSYVTNNRDQLINKWRDLGDVPADFRIYKF